MQAGSRRRETEEIESSGEDAGTGSQIEDPEFQKRTAEIGYAAWYEDGQAAKIFVKAWFENSRELFEKLGMKKK